LVCQNKNPSNNFKFQFSKSGLKQLRAEGAFFVGPPQPILTYGKCVAYHGDVPDIPFALGSLLKFSSLSHYTVARPGVFEALGEIVPAPADLNDRPAKKLCVRVQEEEGQVEQGDVEQGKVVQGKIEEGKVEEGKAEQKKIKQNKALVWEYSYSKYFLIDLDGTKYPTRCKENHFETEKDFWFLFRALDMNRRYAISMMDHCELDIPLYRCYIEDEGNTVHHKRRNEAFATSRFYHRVHTTALFTDPAKMKLFLTGNVKIGGILPNFQLEDFVPKVLFERVTNVYAWPFHKTPLLTILRRLEMAFRVLLSDEYTGLFDQFITDIEDIDNCVIFVPADDVKKAVASVSTKFFCVISTHTPADISMSVKTPAECAMYLKSRIQLLITDYKHYFPDSV
jgi:hypothetical protein